MDNVLLYWIIEYIKVFFGYGFIMFIWPLVVFRKFLSGKNVTFKFCFCSTVQVVLINYVVLFLGLFHLLNKFTMCTVFFGILIWSLREYYVLTEERKKRIKYLFNGTMGKKHFILTWFYNTKKSFKVWLKGLKKFYKKHFIEYTVLILTVIYGMLYFSYGAFRDYSYGFGDMYVHHSWIYGLVEGKIFSEGVYPEGMHCVIYSIHALLGINVYSCNLFLAGIHIAVILLAAYCLMKELFHWRFSAIFVMVLYLIVDLVCIDEVFSMSRLQWTLPQEYAFHTMYICVLYLILYLKSYKKTVFREVELKACWDENLLLFMMALAASIVIHFYVTIMAFFLCFSFAIFKLKSIFNKKHFVPLVVAAFMGVIIAFIPMGGGLISGIPFQGSINWAMSVMSGTDTGEGRTQKQNSSIIESSDDLLDDSNNQNTMEKDYETIDDKETIIIDDLKSGETENPTSVPKYSIFKRIGDKVKTFWNVLCDKLMGVYYQGYITLYKQERAKWIVGASFFAIVLYLVYRFTWFIRFKVLKSNGNPDNIFPDYLPMVFSSFLFVLLYAAPLIGLPEIVAGSRLCSTTQMLILIVMIIPMDMLLSFLNIHFRDDTLEIWSCVVTIFFIAVIYISGSFHGYLYYEFTRYNSAVATTNNIINSLPKNTYTIISTTDEIYQVIQNGRHEEILTFVNNQNKDYYTLPTEYLFIFIEKKPLKYAHNHFFAGPKWLALEKYHEMYQVNYSCCPDILASKISQEYANQTLLYFSRPSQAYSYLESRTILESKMYDWCNRFAQRYPNELQVYYEDDDFICYYIQQNPQFLYNLSLK